MSDFAVGLVGIALKEWDFFGRPEINLNGTTSDGKKEYQDGASERIADYWKQIGGAYKNLTGKDRGYPWSAAFISYCVRSAGAGDRFDYSAGHAAYINQSIRASEKKLSKNLYYGVKPRETKLKPGDLIGYWRGARKITVANARQVGWYQSHTDVVVEVEGKHAYTIGGNVSHSVTRREVRLGSDGTLRDTNKPWFVVMSLQE